MSDLNLKVKADRHQVYKAYACIAMIVMLTLTFSLPGLVLGFVLTGVMFKDKAEA